MDITPPWESSKRVYNESPDRVFWQSSQNPQRFLATVMHSVGESDEHTLRSPFLIQVATLAASRPSMSTSPPVRSTSAPAPSHTRPLKRTSSSSNSIRQNGVSMPNISSTSDSKRPRRSRRFDTHDQSMSVDNMEVDMRRVTDLVLNVSQSLHARPSLNRDSQQTTPKQSSQNGAASILSARVPRARSVLSAGARTPDHNLLDRTNDTQGTISNKDHSRPSSQPSTSHPSSQGESRNQKLLHQPTTPAPLIPEERVDMAYTQRHPTSKNLVPRVPPSSQIDHSARVHSPLPPTVKIEPANNSPSRRSHRHEILPLSIPRLSSLRKAKAIASSSNRSLGMKGLSGGGMVSAGASKPFKVPVLSGARPTTPILNRPPSPPISRTAKENLGNAPSSSDSFEMDSFGADLEAVEACLQKFD